MGGSNVDPLEFAIAVEAGGEVSGDEADDRVILTRDVEDASSERFLWMMRAIHISGDARAPLLFSSEAGAAEACDGGNVFGCGFSNTNRALHCAVDYPKRKQR